MTASMDQWATPDMDELGPQLALLDLLGRVQEHLSAPEPPSTRQPATASAAAGPRAARRACDEELASRPRAAAEACGRRAEPC